MLVETIRLAVEALGRNALRSTLTGLGILIGVGAVIAMITIGHGAAMNVRAEIARLGAQLLTLSVGQQMRGGQGASIAAPPFDYADVEAIRREVRGLRHVAPLSGRTGRVSARNRNANARIVGTENAYFQARGWPLASGRLFNEAEAYNGKPVCLMGSTVRQHVFGEADSIGQTIRLGNVPCTVVGILQERGQTGTAEDDDNVVAVPFDMYQRRVQGTKDVQAIVMAAYPTADMTRLKTSLIGLVRERRGHAAGDADNFHLLDMRQVATSMSTATRTFTLFLGAIAAVSLVVGGIGIMNIMLVSVTERTREIGIRLIIGALPSQIRLQFLCEATILALAGGFLGILVGLGTAAIAAPSLGIPFVLDPVLIGVTVLVSTFIGIGFGFAPAARAALLDPVEALRHN